MDIVLKTLVFIVCFGILIFIHEFGHYLFARMLGFKVLKFSIGFGHPIFKYVSKRSGIEYAIAWIPLGGYVKMLDSREGEVEESEKHLEFNSQKVWKKALVVFAGPFFNLVLALFVLWGLFYVYGTRDYKTYIGHVNQGSMVEVADFKKGDLVKEVGGKEVEGYQQMGLQLMTAALGKKKTAVVLQRKDGSEYKTELDFSDYDLAKYQKVFLDNIGILPPIRMFPAEIGKVVSGGAAEKAGIQVGDRILQIDENKVRNWGDMVAGIYYSYCREITIQLQRDGKTVSINVIPDTIEENGKRFGRIGVEYTKEQQKKFFDSLEGHSIEIDYGFGESFVQAAQKMYDTPALILDGLWNIISGKASPKLLNGPIPIYQLFGKAYDMGLYYVLNLLAVLSISLGVLNLLPVPVLDGGHLFFYIVEAISGRPINQKVFEYGTKVGLALLLTLMVFVFYMDIERLFQESHEKEKVYCEANN
ncbi:MAG: RIP metalloprotease RseP [Gammaproteobacteria bacterium]|nr:MAG: RIP metalloprotease RseP [Gammaproteobacteria bacterium]